MLTIEDLINNKNKLDSLTQRTKGCWWYTGTIDSKGYGRIKIKTTSKNVSTVAWEINHGEFIPEGFRVKAICENKLCVNPSHLELMRRTFPWRI